MAGYIYIAKMDIPPELDAEFNRIYDDEHIPEILKVPGVLGCRRYVLEETANPGLPRYAAIYDLDAPDVIKKAEWRAAADRGEWMPKIRPHTYNRIHGLYRRLP